MRRLLRIKTMVGQNKCGPNSFAVSIYSPSMYQETFNILLIGHSLPFQKFQDFFGDVPVFSAVTLR